MADQKISGLSSGTTPLAGTEELPIVQSSSTVKVTTQDIADLVSSSNIGNADLTIDSAGTRKLIMGGSLSTDIFAIRNSADTANLFQVDGDGDVYSHGKGGVSTNTAFGNGVFNPSTTGGNNVGIGINALNDLTTGTYNVCVGENNGNGITTGANNVMIGRSNTTTDSGVNRIVGIGYQASNKGSDDCTYLGGRSGYNMEGVRNTVISPYNSTGTGITTGSNNTIIGRLQGLSTTLSNNVILADGQGNNAIWKDSNHNVGVGYTPASDSQDV